MSNRRYSATASNGDRRKRPPHWRSTWCACSPAARFTNPGRKPGVDKVTKELVDWFNAVDATYRADLRELNELNFARFDAKMGERLAEFDTKLERRFAEYDVTLERRFADFDTKLERGLAQLRTEIAETRADLTNWMFVFWAPTAIGVVALLLRR